MISKKNRSTRNKKRKSKSTNSMSKHLHLEVEDKENIRLAVNGNMYIHTIQGKRV